MFTSISYMRLHALMPLAALLTGALAFQGAHAYEAKAKTPADIVDTAVAAGSFNTLATALKAPVSSRPSRALVPSPCSLRRTRLSPSCRRHPRVAAEA